jgi:heme-degrading monooxygenase HmoA
MAVRAELTMTVPAERAGRFVEEWDRLAGWIATVPGCLRQTLSRAADGDVHAYVITSDWVDRPTYEEFEHSSRQDDATAALRELRASVAMRVLTIVEHKEGS